jgi:hypothetical protein
MWMTNNKDPLIIWYNIQIEQIKQQIWQKPRAFSFSAPITPLSTN